MRWHVHHKTVSTFFHFCPTSPYPEFSIMFIQSVFTTGQFDFPLPSPDRYILDVRESPVMESAARSTKHRVDQSGNRLFLQCLLQTLPYTTRVRITRILYLHTLLSHKTASWVPREVNGMWGISWMTSPFTQIQSLRTLTLAGASPSVQRWKVGRDMYGSV